jgi:hypothetical protein
VTKRQARKLVDALRETAGWRSQEVRHVLEGIATAVERAFIGADPPPLAVARRATTKPEAPK